MSRPDVQYFDSDGTWVKPPGAVRVEVTLKGGDGAKSAVLYAKVGHQGGGGGDHEAALAGAGVSGYAPVQGLGKSVPGEAGETVTESFAADDLPDLLSIEVGQLGGFASVVTHLDNGEQQR